MSASPRKRSLARLIVCASLIRRQGVQFVFTRDRGGNAEQQSRATQARTEALRLLAPFLALPADNARRVLAAVEGIATDLFPATSWELPRGSTQALNNPRPHFLCIYLVRDYTVPADTGLITCSTASQSSKFCQNWI